MGGKVVKREEVFCDELLEQAFWVVWHMPNLELERESWAGSDVPNTLSFPDVPRLQQFLLLFPVALEFCTTSFHAVLHYLLIVPRHLIP